MKEIRNFMDIELIVEYKLDVRDSQGYLVPYVRFISLPLIEIIKLLKTGWKYDP